MASHSWRSTLNLHFRMESQLPQMNDSEWMLVSSDSKPCHLSGNYSSASRFGRSDCLVSELSCNDLILTSFGDVDSIVLIHE